MPSLILAVLLLLYRLRSPHPAAVRRLRAGSNLRAALGLSVGFKRLPQLYAIRNQS
jgi:hypothetical protein